MSSLVSVIVPIYKVEEYVDKCIESVVNQTYENLEIILVDDGSPDLCPQKCDDWAEKDGRIKVIHKENGGLGFARNSGIDVATGQYITFVDSDDYLALNSIEVMVQRIERDQSDLVIAQHMMAYSDGTLQPSIYPWLHDEVITKEEAMRRIGIRKQSLPVYAWGKIYRKHMIDQCSTISITDKVVYYYLQRDTSIFHSKAYIQKIDDVVASLHLARFLYDHNHLEGARAYYYSALCQSIELKPDKKAAQLVKNF